MLRELWPGFEDGPFRYVNERAWKRDEVKTLPARENATASATLTDNCRNESIQMFASRFERYMVGSTMYQKFTIEFLNISHAQLYVTMQAEQTGMGLQQWTRPTSTFIPAGQRRTLRREIAEVVGRSFTGVLRYNASEGIGCRRYKFLDFRPLF